jgi:hypothetical protein
MRFFCNLGHFIACSSLFLGVPRVVARSQAPLICCAPAARQLGSETLPLPMHDAMIVRSVFFIVHPTLQAHSQLVQLPPDTTCSLQALFSPFWGLDKARPLQAGTSPLLAPAISSASDRACESQCRNRFIQDCSSNQHTACRCC